MPSLKELKHEMAEQDARLQLSKQSIVNYLQRFYNGWLDRLLNHWWKFYYEKRDGDELKMDFSKFSEFLRSEIQWYIDSLNWKYERKDRIAVLKRGTAIESKYKWLLFEEKHSNELVQWKKMKEEWLVAWVWTNSRVTNTLAHH